MSVTNALNVALYGKMNAATALTGLLAGTTSIYYQQAPDEAVFDYVVFSYQGGGPTNYYPHESRDQLIFVRGYSTTGPAAAGTIDSQISTLLHRGSVNVSGYSNYWLARETDVNLVENTPNKTKVWMAGAIYRVRLDT